MPAEREAGMQDPVPVSAVAGAPGRAGLAVGSWIPSVLTARATCHGLSVLRVPRSALCWAAVHSWGILARILNVSFLLINA